LLEVVDKTSLEKYNMVASVYKVLSNPVRLKILVLLDSKSMGFSELMRALAINPKVLSSCLSSLMGLRLVVKSYPHRVYVLTPSGRRILREQIEGIYDYLNMFVKPLKEE